MIIQKNGLRFCVGRERNVSGSTGMTHYCIEKRSHNGYNDCIRC